MAVKNTCLGGTNFSTPTARVKPTDLNDTFNCVANKFSFDNTGIKNLFQLVAVNNGENAINLWAFTNSNASQINFSLIKGAAFICNAAGNKAVTNFGNLCNTTCGYVLCQTNFTDCFANTGCYPTTANGCWFGCFIIAGQGTPYSCVCAAGTLINRASGNYYGSPGGPYDAYVCLIDCLRTYADCYRFCFCTNNCYCYTAGTCGSFLGCMQTMVCVNTSVLANICDVVCNSCHAQVNCTTAFVLYELRRVANTNSCYCFLKNSVLQCCLDTTGCPITIITYGSGAAGGGGGTTNISYISCACFKEYTACYINNRKYLKSQPINFTAAPTYLVLSCCRKDSGTDLMCADLFCCDGVTCLGSIAYGTVTNVSAYNLCSYVVGIKNNCIPSNCNACPVCAGGYALEGIYYNG